MLYQKCRPDQEYPRCSNMQSMMIFILLIARLARLIAISTMNKVKPNLENIWDVDANAGTSFVHYNGN